MGSDWTGHICLSFLQIFLHAMRTSSAVPMRCASLAAGTVMATVTVLMAQMNKTVQPLLVQTLNFCVLEKIGALKSQSSAIATETAVMAQMKLQHVVSIFLIFNLYIA